MKNIIRIITLILLLCGSIAAQTLSVNNVRFAQRGDGSFMVDVYYDLTLATTRTATITMQASADNGTTWGLNCNSLTGAVGNGITAGTNKHIVWNFSADNANFYNEQIKIKIIADDGVPFVCGTDIVTYAGKTYYTVQIGTQCWLKENLDVGTMIQGTQHTTNNGVIEKYCYCNASREKLQSC